MLLVLALTSCGYFQSGTWEDDPKNWERAWGGPKPAGAQVVHSRFTRYPHWTYEATFYFQLRLTDEIERTLLKKFRRVEDSVALSAKQGVFSDAPAWFAPVPHARYDVWVLDESVGVLGTVLRDRDTADFFVFVSQL